VVADLTPAKRSMTAMVADRQTRTLAIAIVEMQAYAAKRNAEEHDVRMVREVAMQPTEASTQCHWSAMIPPAQWVDAYGPHAERVTLQTDAAAVVVAVAVAVAAVDVVVLVVVVGRVAIVVACVDKWARVQGSWPRPHNLAWCLKTVESQPHSHRHSHSLCR
jgi:hypothetical protein